ncbi:MAG TPA: hypothetical protein VNI20_06165 [Fimbriimonadaceae bacterium]|nr:hypothetical protein [Fimbriimonadaceae bacterium]
MRTLKVSPSASLAVLLTILLTGCKHVVDERDLVGQWSGTLSIMSARDSNIGEARVEEYSRLRDAEASTLILGENMTYTLETPLRPSIYQGIWRLQGGKVVLHQTWSGVSNQNLSLVMVPKSKTDGSTSYTLSADGNSLIQILPRRTSDGSLMMLTFCKNWDS